MRAARRSFWTTLPGILTALAAIITALTGLVIALDQLGFLTRHQELPEDQPLQAKQELPEDQSPKTAQSLPKDQSPQAKQELLPVVPTAISNHIFSDDFSSQTMGNDWQPVSGDWYVKNGVLNGISTEHTEYLGTEWAAITLGKEIPNDCSVSFRTRIVDGHTAELMLHLSSNRYIRVYLYKTGNAVYLGDGTFIRNNNPGNIGLEKVLVSIGGGITLIAHSFPVKLGVWYAITVTSTGNVYSLKVGGQQLIQYVDTENELSREGTIGFLTNGHAQFDNIKVTSRFRDDHP